MVTRSYSKSLADFLKRQTRPNQRMKLAGAAILVSRGIKVVQAAPGAYP